MNVQIGELLNLKKPARNRDGSYRMAARKLSAHFRMLEEDLFPDPLYRFETTRAALEIPFSQLTYNERLQLVDPVNHFPDNVEVAKEFKEQVKKLLGSLPIREQEVLKMRFGIEGDEQTLEQVGQYFHVTKERIRQIEAKALRRLKHPKRSRRLSEYLTLDTV